MTPPRVAVVTGVNLALTAAAFLLTAARYRMLAERLPIHWNLRGEPDGWAPRRFGAWLMPAVMLTGQVFWSRVRAVAGPGGAQSILAWIEITTNVFLLFVTMLMLDAGLEERGRMPRRIWFGLGLYLAAIVCGIPLLRG